MALRYTILLSVVLACVSAQSNSFRVCVSSTDTAQCRYLDQDDSQAFCKSVQSRVDCALQLARGTADIGYFTAEELLVLTELQRTEHRVVATIRDSTDPPVSFEAVAVVSNAHTGGLQGLRGGKYCHPGLGEAPWRWSPRVEKAFEVSAAGTDRCPDADINHKTAEEMEASTLSQFFGQACRPGAWSANATHDADLKRQYPNLCALCGPNSQCDYTIELGPNIAGVNNNNGHIKALECLRTGGSVAYVAWEHVKEFFFRNPGAVEFSNFSILCPDNSQVALTLATLNENTAPCAFVRQPWSAIVATSARAAEVQASLRAWWPSMDNPNDGSWRSALYKMLVPPWHNTRVNFEETLLSPADYTGPIRTVPSSDAAAPCIPARKWCTISDREFQKCLWLSTAAYVLGIQPTISCQQRTDYFDCLRGVRDRQVDFLATPANYGYLARQNYRLAPVKLVQNQRTNPNSFSRVTALLRTTTATAEVTRFENLKGKKACFPEYGGISYVSFVRTAQQLGVLSSSECDYAKVVGEFFESSCAPGALSATHALSETSYDATPLCTACPATWSTKTTVNITCGWNYNDNKYFGNNGSLACLADNDVHVAFVETQNLAAHLSQLGLNGDQFRVLCRNNTLALSNGINVDNQCLLSYVVDSEVLTRRNDPAFNSISTLLDTLEEYFGYTASYGTQHINIEMFSSFDGTNDLLFKNTALGFLEPTEATYHEPVKNYIELFKDLQACTSAGSDIAVPGLANRSLYSIVTWIASTLLTRFVTY